MVRNLLLIRHAEAEFLSDDQKDFERDLTAKGKNQASVLATHISDLPIEIQALYHSPAQRTLSTAQAIYEGVNYESRLMDAEELYEATGNLMKAFVTRLDDNFQNAAIIAHNPGISELYTYLSQKIEGFLPATSCWLEFQADSWSEISGNSGVVKDIYYPGMS